MSATYGKMDDEERVEMQIVQESEEALDESDGVVHGGLVADSVWRFL